MEILFSKWCDTVFIWFIWFYLNKWWTWRAFLSIAYHFFFNQIERLLIYLARSFWNLLIKNDFKRFINFIKCDLQKSISSTTVTNVETNIIDIMFWVIIQMYSLCIFHEIWLRLAIGYNVVFIGVMCAMCG